MKYRNNSNKMKKNLKSQEALLNNIKFPIINLKINNNNFNPKNNGTNKKNINKINTKTYKIKKEETFNNKIDDITININKKFNISKKVNTSLNNEIKKENISSFFVNDFTIKNFFIRKNNDGTAKENIKLNKNNNLIVFPMVTKEQLEKIKLLNNKRLFLEKKEHYKKLLEDYSEKIHKNKKNEANIYNLDFQIKVTKRKVLSILEDSGIIEPNDYLINNLKKTEWPKKHFYEYSSNIIKGYKNKLKEKQIRRRNEITEKYLELKMKNYADYKDNQTNNMKIFRGLNKRESNKFNNKLDKSRSTVHIVPINKTSLTSIDNTISQEEIPIFKCTKLNIHFRNKNSNFNIRNIYSLNNKIIKNKSQTSINNINKEKLFFRINSNKNSDIAHLNISQP